MGSNEAMSVILCTAGYDHTIRFWEALSGICTRQINYSESQINRLCISPDKKYLAAAGHHTVKLYLVRSPQHHQAGANPNNPNNPAAAAAAAQQAAVDHNSRSNDPVQIFEGHTNNITGVGFHVDTKWMVTSSEDGTVKIWDTKSGSVQRNYAHGSPVNDVVIHPNQGELISCDRAGNVRIWDLGENKCSHQLIPEEDVSVASVTVASDGSLLCAGNNAGNVYIWRLHATLDTTSLVPVCKFSAHATYITRVLLSPDVKHLATCSADHTTRIWGVHDPIAASSSSASTSHTNSANVSRSSSRSNSLSSDFGGALRRRQQVQPGRQVNGDDASPIKVNGGGDLNGEVPSSPSAMTPSASFPLEATLAQHQRWVWDCAFSADSAYLVTACSDHYARLWELGSQSIIRQYNGHHRGAMCVALNDYSDAPK